VEQNWGLEVKGQGHWERKCKNLFTRISSSKVERLTSNQNRNDQRPIILHIYGRIHFTSSRNASFFCDFIDCPSGRAACRSSARPNGLFVWNV